MGSTHNSLARRDSWFSPRHLAVVEALPELRDCRVGVLHVFIQHTSASLAINENADPDVRRDFERAFNALVPQDFPYEHTTEGPDDMPAHIKAARRLVAHLARKFRRLGPGHLAGDLSVRTSRSGG